MDITEGICWHFLDVPAGVPFLPQEDGRFGSIFQVLFPEIAALAHNPPETHTTNFAKTNLNPKGKAQLAHLPQARQEVLAFSLRTPHAPASPTQLILRLRMCAETKASFGGEFSKNWYFCLQRFRTEMLGLLWMKHGWK